MHKISPLMRECLTYYRDNENNPDRRVFTDEWRWTMRQVNTALDRGWLAVGPGGWHILSFAGRAALKSEAHSDV